MSIYTIPSATYDTADNQTLHNQDIKALTEENLFEVPENLELVENGTYGKVMMYPMGLN